MGEYCNGCFFDKKTRRLLHKRKK
ncbi:hypothetical protein [Sphingobacterium corticibacterium]